jgi:hypothetical protein
MIFGKYPELKKKSGNIPKNRYTKTIGINIVKKKM